MIIKFMVQKIIINQLYGLFYNDHATSNMTESLFKFKLIIVILIFDYKIFKLWNIIINY